MALRHEEVGELGELDPTDTVTRSEQFRFPVAHPGVGDVIPLDDVIETAGDEAALVPAEVTAEVTAGVTSDQAVDVAPSAPVEQARPARGRRQVLGHPMFVLESWLVLGVDCLTLAALLLIAGRASAPLAVLTALGAMATWGLAGLYRQRIALSVLDDLPALAVGVLFGLAAAVTATSAAGRTVSARDVAIVGGGALALTVAGRCLGYVTVLHERAHGRLGRRAVMIGAGSHARALGERIAAHPESGIRLIGTVANQPSRVARELPVLGSPRDLAPVLRRFDVTDVVIGYGGMSSAELVDVLRTCDRAGAEIFMVPRLFELYTLRRGDDHIWGLPLVRVRRPAQRAVTWRVKRAFDVAVAALGLVCVAPLMAAIALAVRLELGPGLIFRQTRIGLNGRPFELLKFRSIRPAPQVGASLWRHGEDQVGRVGGFIRRYSLDELPQLYNVLRGDMSLVGPRPERPEYVEQFCAAVPRYVHRHRVPVGMTGLAAVNGLRGDTSIEDRAHFDNWYIDNWSLWLDVKIMVRTLKAVIRGTGG